MSAIHAYVARWTAQPLPAAAALQKDASTGIVRQVCLVAEAPVRGSACSLATALECAVLADRLLGMDINETPVRCYLLRQCCCLHRQEGLYSALLSPSPSVQRAAYVILARGSVKQAEALLARAKSAPAKEADAQGAESEKVEVEKHEETLLPGALKKVLQSDKLLSVLSAADAEHHHASSEAIGFVLTWSALLDLLQVRTVETKYVLILHPSEFATA